ncbi:MAG: ASPIC/UnbV domain-containing protein, partial [Verrucomicrobiota bacterium]
AGADDHGEGRAAILFDYDNDGDLDAYIGNNRDLVPLGGDNWDSEPGRPVFLRNVTPTSNHWLKVTLNGTPPFHHDGIGSRVYITTPAGTQMRELNASTGFLGHGPNRIAHVGLGAATVVDEVRAEWSNGDAVIMTNVACNQALSLPSPNASAPRVLCLGETFTASASHLTNHVDWTIGGSNYANPATAYFRAGGPKELRLNVYASDGTTVLWTEVYRATVGTDPAIVAVNMMSLTQDMFRITWLGESGSVYNIVGAPESPGSPWTNIGPSMTGTTTGPLTFDVPATASNGFFRVMRMTP